MRTSLALVFLFLAVATPPARGQEMLPGRANAVFLELFGNGGLFSLNYERMIVQSVALRGGIANWAVQDTERTTVTTIPLTVSKLFGAGDRGFEVGGGLVLGKKTEEERDWASGGWVSPESSGIVNLTGILGYRWVWPSGWMFRVGLTPILTLSGDYPDDGLTPSGGLSFGRVF